LLPTCQALARDMLSCVPEVTRRYKSVIDAGYADTFARGLAIESDAAREHARGVSRETLAARRAAVQQRGREQSKA